MKVYIFQYSNSIQLLKLKVIGVCMRLFELWDLWHCQRDTFKLLAKYMCNYWSKRWWALMSPSIGEQLVERSDSPLILSLRLSELWMQVRSIHITPVMSWGPHTPVLSLKVIVCFFNICRICNQIDFEIKMNSLLLYLFT